MIQIKASGGYTIILKINHEFSGLDIEFAANIIDPIKITQKNLNSIVMAPKLLSQLSLIVSNLSDITHIQALEKYRQIYDKSPGPEKEPLRIPLKTIKLYFPDEFLFQIHRSYLVNPKEVVKWRRKSKAQFEMLVGDSFVPIGLKYLDKVKENFPIN